MSEEVSISFNNTKGTQHPNSGNNLIISIQQGVDCQATKDHESWCLLTKMEACYPMHRENFWDILQQVQVYVPNSSPPRSLSIDGKRGAWWREGIHGTAKIFKQIGVKLNSSAIIRRCVSVGTGTVTRRGMHEQAIGPFDTDLKYQCHQSHQHLSSWQLRSSHAHSYISWKGTYLRIHVLLIIFQYVLAFRILHSDFPFSIFHFPCAAAISFYHL